MYTGLVLFYVGAVLILNGLWMRGRIQDQEVAIINWLVGGLCALVALHLAFASPVDPAAVSTAAFSLLFAFTYLWVAYNRRVKSDGAGLGWFSLFVAVNALIIAADGMVHADSGWALWTAISWALWAVLWFVFFLMLAKGRELLRLASTLAIVEGVVTGWIPGMLLLQRGLT